MPARAWLIIIVFTAFQSAQSFTTPTYGLIKIYHRNPLSIQATISGVSSWGTHTYTHRGTTFSGAVGNLTFSFINNSQSGEVIGHGPSDEFTACNPFQLAPNDYIHGYRVLYADYIFGLTFYTFLNHSYSCPTPLVSSGIHNDSGIVIYGKHYLSALHFEADWVIDSMHLEFSLIDSLTVPICVTGSDEYANLISGVYEYVHFDYTRMTPIYHCTDCEWNAFLHGVIVDDSMYSWVIGRLDWLYDWDSAACVVGYDLTGPYNSQYVFDIADCSSSQWFAEIFETSNFSVTQCSNSSISSSANFDIASPSYGAFWERNTVYYVQDTISGVSSWGTWSGEYDFYSAIGHLNLTFVDVNNSHRNSIYIIGNGASMQFTACDPFQMTTNDYVHGYRVIYDTVDTTNNHTFIFGLTFYTANNHSYSCPSNNSSTNDSYNDSGVVIHEGHYLSGMHLSAGWVIEGVRFEFTRFADLTPNITLDTTTTPVVSTSNIVVETHVDIASEWIAFYVFNVDLSCGGWIDNVAITDFVLYQDQWVNYTNRSGNYFEFGSNLSQSFTIPISVRITRGYFDEELPDQKCLEILIAERLIYSLTGGMTFDFGENFCHVDTEFAFLPKQVLDYTFYYVVSLITAVFVVVGVLSLLDARCCRKNDYFVFKAIFSALLHVLDVWSDIFNSFNFATSYQQFGDIQFLYICFLSIVFILLPIIASLIQLHRASSKYWLYDNRMREWLLSYSKLLYFVSVITGSSFAAVDIFNSNLFGLNVFYMGISRQYLLGFTAKQVYSIVLLENTPQLILSSWYLVLLGKFDLIAVVSAAFSTTSIVVTVIAMCLQKRIYKTQDYAHFTMDVTGECVMTQLKICKNRIRKTKTFLCRSILGVQEKSVEIQKPFEGDIPSGVRLHIHISYVWTASGVNPAARYEDLLNTAIDTGSLQNALKEEWELEALPEIDSVECRVKGKRMGTDVEAQPAGEPETNQHLTVETDTHIM